MPKVIQIQAVRYTNLSKLDCIALFGLGADGKVYQYRFDREPEGWIKLTSVTVNPAAP